MNEFYWAGVVDWLVWTGSVIAPLVVGVITAVIAHRSSGNRVRICFFGALCAFAFGAAGSFACGEGILRALGATSVPHDLFVESWHSMWYPLGTSLLVGIALAFYSSLYERKEAA